MKLQTTPAVLAVALAALCAGGIAAAQTKTPPKSDAAAEAQLEAARADLERAAKRVAELSRQLGREEGPVRIERRMIRRPVLGVLLAPDDQTGVRIAGVTPDSAAAAAGLKSGDRVTSIGGRQILGSSGALRVENARKLLAELDTKTPVKLGYLRDGRSATVSVTPKLDDDVVVLRGHGDAPMAIERMHPPGVAPRIRSEVFRIGPRGECKGKDCKLPAFAEAFRWHGLNLASVDRSLGRYFGTERGVLVLSTGELAGLQPGDVIQKIDGKAVDSPREAMDVLHDKPADALVLVEYLRDRKVASTRVKVPKALPLRIPLPPPPPAAPAAPRAPAAPPPPPPPPAAASVDDVVILRDVRIAMAPEAMQLPLPPEAPLPPDAPAIEDIDVVVETY
jgi:membrane-associated protease RseP (regulator of RpoE activity)